MPIHVDNYTPGELRFLEECAAESRGRIQLVPELQPDGQVRLVIRARQRRTLDKLSQRLDAMREQRSRLAALYALPSRESAAGGRDFFISAVQRRLHELSGEVYAHMDPEEHLAALESLPLAPLYDLLDGLGVFYYELTPGAGLNRELYGSLFELSPEAVARFFAIITDHHGDPQACRSRVHAFLSTL